MPSLDQRTFRFQIGNHLCHARAQDANSVGLCLATGSGTFMISLQLADAKRMAEAMACAINASESEPVEPQEM